MRNSIAFIYPPSGGSVAAPQKGGIADFLNVRKCNNKCEHIQKIRIRLLRIQFRGCLRLFGKVYLLEYKKEVTNLMVATSFYDDDRLN